MLRIACFICEFRSILNDGAHTETDINFLYKSLKGKTLTLRWSSAQRLCPLNLLQERVTRHSETTQRRYPARRVAESQGLKNTAAP